MRSVPRSEQWNISIHALRGEGDGNHNTGFNIQFKFQSTPSAGRATGVYHLYTGDCSISIHALRGEGDATTVSVLHNFQRFQSTPSAGRATAKMHKFYLRFFYD